MTDAMESPAGSGRRGGPRARARGTSRRRILADRWGRHLINAGGLLIIASVLGIFVFIAWEVRPLLDRAEVRPLAERRWSAAGVGALVVDEHRTHAASLSLDGRIRVARLGDGAIVVDRALEPAQAGAEGEEPPAPPGLTAVRALPDQAALSAATEDGRVLIVPLAWSVTFERGERRVGPEIPDPVALTLDPGGRPLTAYTARIGEDGSAAAAALMADGTLALVRRETRENLLTGEVEEALEREEAPSPRSLTQILIDRDVRNLYGSTGGGEILWWKLNEGLASGPEIVSAGVAGITAMALLIGDRSLVVGQESGALSVWFPVRSAGEVFTLTRIRDFPLHGGAIHLLAPSARAKGFIAQDRDGTLGLYHSTSHRVLWKGASPVPEAAAIAYAPKADAAILASDERLAEIEVVNPHPETSPGALFGETWYEGSEGPELVWQSSSGTDDFEPKLSLTPLVAGTLKGTLYSLILAVPLGVLGAMYTSQFMHPGLQKYVKPAVEIMAALPSVVIGFIAGLWLAPRVERLVPALILMVFAVPAAVVAAGSIWDRPLAPLRRRLPRGSEVVLLAAVVAGAAAASIAAGPALESVAFGGDFQAWLYETTGLRYDQRNAVVVGLAMGFAVIPIIFAIAEDAFSNVPRSLISGSLALGADQWQTVTRVVLPMASPGIFSAVMIGFGRAVGETMIVLMATGNTPIMDWNPFNGFRTLSANIAVEIPEAPHGGTLYRTLFLAGLLLFVVTFVINTAAELVRMRLRRRYAQL